ncbi:hypothetical protein ANN_02062 [Periplaneta americana]|uniref:Uncharacterized protein n=1 Tax=Periplaneta americana TaxID=6978 RepID=A0ABQ8TXQ8_PERAM|nr:hypothetical protein ANN_02062 [Periplaneta americana]
MAGLCEGGNEPPGSLKARKNQDGDFIATNYKFLFHVCNKRSSQKIMYDTRASIVMIVLHDHHWIVVDTNTKKVRESRVVSDIGKTYLYICMNLQRIQQFDLNESYMYTRVIYELNNKILLTIN